MEINMHTHTQGEKARERERNKRTHCSVSFGALHVQRNKAGMGEEEKGGWGLAQHSQPGQDEWKQSSVQITSRKTEGIWKFALMRSVAEEEKQQQKRERELDTEQGPETGPGLYYKTNKQQAASLPPSPPPALDWSI